MNTIKITEQNLYAANNQKQTGDKLTATEWNNISTAVNTAQTKINDLIDDVAEVSGTSEESNSSYMYVNDKGNLCIETTAENVPTGKKGKINIESKDDIQIKPGDDVIFTSSHRPVSNLDEVSMKIHDGEDHPVKLQLNAADIVLTTKDKSLTMTKDENGDDTSIAMYDDPAVMNITVNSAKNTRGYLKVRAQAIDLRSESHGGIALQPKGFDSDNNMNKIKFEHGGGDGLEFGTFNTEHTSIYTNDYRFKKDGVIRLANRFTEVSDKADENDATTAYKYLKNNATNNAAKAQSESVTYNQADDFYDFVDSSDPTCTWEDIVKAVYWMKTNNEGPWASQL